MTSSEKYIASDAATTIGNIAIDSTHQILLCRLGATENLIRLMESSLECCLSSCRAISRMAIPNENKPICVENRSLLHHLIHFCSSQNKHLLRFTATGICNLSSNDKAQEGLVESNGVKALLLLTRNNSDDVVQAATKALCNLGIRKKNQD